MGEVSIQGLPLGPGTGIPVFTLDSMFRIS